MDIANSIRRSWKQEVIIQSIIWNTIIEIFETEKNIDIKKYLVSIKLKWENILVKTNKPIINTELYLLNEQIKKVSQDKLKKLWLYKLNFDIKYL